MTVSLHPLNWREGCTHQRLTFVRVGTLFSPKYTVISSYAVDEWQVIEISSQNGGSWKVPKETEQDAKDSPPTRARKRWKNAINQQLLLNRMEKENQQLKSELRYSLVSVYSLHGDSGGKEEIEVVSHFLAA